MMIMFVSFEGFCAQQPGGAKSYLLCLLSKLLTYFSLVLLEVFFVILGLSKIPFGEICFIFVGFFFKSKLLVGLKTTD